MSDTPTVLTVLGSVTLGTILAPAVVAKAARPRASVGAYQRLPLPRRGRAGVAVAGIVTEGTLAALLFTRSYLPIVLACAAALFAAFCLLATTTLRREGSTACGCLGGLGALEFSATAAYLNACLAVAAVALSVIASVSELRGLALSTHVALWLSAALLSTLYWLAQYAASVRGRMHAALHERTM